MRALIRVFENQLGQDLVDCPFFGRIMNNKHFDRIIQMLADELKVSGSKIVYGGQHNRLQNFIHPTIVTGINPKYVKQHPIMNQEIFGPILPVIKFETLDQAIQIIQQVDENPLAIYPFSTDNRFIETIWERINGGMFLANDTIISIGINELPFGGVGTSGVGVYHGSHSYDTFTRKQGFVVRGYRFAFLDSGRKFPIAADYDSSQAKSARKFLIQKLPSNFQLKLSNLFRKLRLKLVFCFLILFAAGIWIGSIVF